VAGTYQDQSVKTSLEDSAFARTVSRLASIYEGRLDRAQLTELAKLASANRKVFEQKLTGYLPTLRPVELGRLSRAYYAEDPDSRKNFERLMRKHEPDLDMRRLESIMKDVSADWKNNQKLFERRMTAYVPGTDQFQAVRIYSHWAELDRCYSLLSRAENAAALAFRTANPLMKSELKEELSGIRILNQIIFNVLSRIADMSGAPLGLDLGALTQESLQRIAGPLGSEQRTTLFALALEAGFSSSVVNVARSYFRII